MKFCYLDESGMGSEPILVMAGIVVDAHRMHVTKAVWSDFLERLSSVAKRHVTEFHAKDFYGGNGPWRGMDGQARSDVISTIMGWLKERKHSITFNAIQKKNFDHARASGSLPSELGSPWIAAATHCILSLQKHLQKAEKNKGHFVSVFDRRLDQEARLTAIIHNLTGLTFLSHRES